MKKSFMVLTFFTIFNSICLASQGSIFQDIEELGEAKTLNSTYRKSNDKRVSFNKYYKIESPSSTTNNHNISGTMNRECTELFGFLSLEEHEQRQKALEREGIEKFINFQNDPLNSTAIPNLSFDHKLDIPEEFLVHSPHYTPNYVDLTSEKNSDADFIVGEELKNISPKNTNFLNLNFEKKSSEFMPKVLKGRISKSKRKANNVTKQLCSLSLSEKSLSKDEN